MSEFPKSSIIYGRNPVLELLDSDKTIEKILLKKGTRGTFEIELRNKLKGKDIPVQHVPEEKLNRISSANHQGVIAITSLIEYQELEHIIPFVFEKGEIPSILFLDGVTDVRNFGAIARSAEVFGVHAIVIPARGSARINEDAMKSSSGALLHLPVCRVHSIGNALQICKDYGLQIIAADMNGDENVAACDLSVPFALILGSEGEGVSTHIEKLVDKTCFITQVGKTESLNVSIASAIILYESSKQRAK